MSSRSLRVNSVERDYVCTFTSMDLSDFDTRDIDCDLSNRPPLPVSWEVLIIFFIELSGRGDETRHCTDRITLLSLAGVDGGG
jgi:hypothetical protein